MIDEDTLDYLLARSAPRAVHPADCLACHAAAQLDRRVARRRTAVGSVIAAGALVGVAAAGAAAAQLGLPLLGNPASGTYVIGSGAACHFTFEAIPDHAPADSPNLLAAQEILSQIDIASLDISEAVADAERYDAEHPDSRFDPPVGTWRDLVERRAVFTVVTQIMHDELAEQGFDSTGIAVTEHDSCDTAP